MPTLLLLLTVLTLLFLLPYISAGHYDMISFFAVAQNDSIGRVRYQLLEVRGLQ